MRPQPSLSRSPWFDFRGVLARCTPRVTCQASLLVRVPLSAVPACRQSVHQAGLQALRCDVCGFLQSCCCHRSNLARCLRLRCDPAAAVEPPQIVKCSSIRCRLETLNLSLGLTGICCQSWEIKCLSPAAITVCEALYMVCECVSPLPVMPQVEEAADLNPISSIRARALAFDRRQP